MQGERFEGHGFGAAWHRPRLHVTQNARESMDLMVCVALCLIAAAATFWAEGSLARLAVTLPILLTVPGYLLLQALIVPAASASRRTVHVLLAFGVSPVVVGLLALSTTAVPDAFRPQVIVAVVTIVCLGLAATSVVRRSVHGRQATHGTHPASP